MGTHDYSTAVGVFTDDTQVEHALNELRRVGFSADEISVWKSGAETGGFFDNLKNLFTGHKATPTVDDFISMGVPEQDAGYYQSELAAGRTIVLVRAGDLQQSALRVLRQFGAYDASMRQQ